MNRNKRRNFYKMKNLMNLKLFPFTSIMQENLNSFYHRIRKKLKSLRTLRNSIADFLRDLQILLHLEQLAFMKHLIKSNTNTQNLISEISTRNKNRTVVGNKIEDTLNIQPQYTTSPKTQFTFIRTLLQ